MLKIKFDDTAKCLISWLACTKKYDAGEVICYREVYSLLGTWQADAGGNGVMHVLASNKNARQMTPV